MNDTKLKVVIAEDDVESATIVKRFIKNICDNPITTNSGREVVEIIRDNPDTDVLLLDIRLHNMNGYDAAKAIRKFNKDIIIIAQTAYAFIGDEQEALDAGCNDYVLKPYSRELLIDKIIKYFKNKKEA